MRSFRVRALKNTFRHADAWIFCFSFLLLIFFFLSEAHIHRVPPEIPVYRAAGYRVLLAVLICILFYLSAALAAERRGDRLPILLVLWLSFAVYLYLILNFTLFDKALGRGNGWFSSEKDMREQYLRFYVNLRPFKSIYSVYIRGFLGGYVSRGYMLLNLAGNVCAFMPFAFFLPALFRPMRQWFVFLPTMLLTVAAVEALQFAFMVGSCDVDDLILNTGGAFLCYFLLRLPPFARVASLLAGEPYK